MDTSSDTQKKQQRHLVFLDPESSSKHASDIYQKVGARCMSPTDWVNPDSLAENEAVVLDSLGIGIFNMPREALEKKFGKRSVMADLRLTLPQAVEKDPAAETASPTGPTAGTLKDGVDTWGRQAVGAPAGAPTGKGVKVCIVDSGITADHPDFRRQSPANMRGFPFASVIKDFTGHGTHCAGIICGSASPASPPRYGVAPEVDLFVANVFGSSNNTSASIVMTAVEWAISQHCDIVSLSLQTTEEDAAGAAFKEDFKKFEKLAKRALDSRVLLVASTGNSSDRAKSLVVKSAFPARCPSVLAVGGVDNQIAVMNMSNSGAEVFGPGDEIFSATTDGGHGIRSGTSMAAAFVAGVAALHAETDSRLRGRDLLARLKTGSGKKPSLPRGFRSARLVAAP